MDHLDTTSDAELLRRSSVQPEAFGELYDRHANAVHAFCLRRTGSSHTAADLTAEVFAAAFIQRARYQEQTANARPWLLGIAARQIGTFVRKERVASRYRSRLGINSLATGQDEFERVEALIDGSSAVASLELALEQLPDGQREAVVLRVVQGLSFAEVGRRLGCSEGAARVRVCRALSRLVELLEGGR